VGVGLVHLEESVEEEAVEGKVECSRRGNPLM
jgi:hypothetical protein